MGKLKIDTKASLYESIEIEIDGETFPVRRIDEDALEELKKLDKRLLKGDPKAGYDRIRLFIGNQKVIAKLSPVEIREITNFITENLFSPKEEEKNLQKPGQEKSLS